MISHVDFSYRIEYDAYRTDLEILSQSRSEANGARLEEATQLFEQHKTNFEKLRSDVTIKLKFLDENRVCLHQAIFRFILLHNITNVWSHFKVYFHFTG